LDSFTKAQLHALCDQLLTGDSAAVAACIRFMELETMGVWHGRARAMMARRLKHCRLSDSQRERLVRPILERFASGRFSEQFKDQLRLVLHLDPDAAFTAAWRCREAPREHVRRYAEWVLAHQE
jgi:hypothetical protein